MSILIAILKSIDTTFDYTKNSENHRLTSLNYYKISKFIEIQLSLARENRISPKDLYLIITNDIQNLKDKEPTIKQDIIRCFNSFAKDSKKYLFIF